ncbi:MAG: nickel-responsive transcriptional regulator NikR [Thermoplasmata archaeon]|nr:MAG: nickel-responsive transcriptional regulator NikR [Thermoplasmata archaeon]RLF32652.1 MAG: nickel-responsive transcriptional regulator NikR [Thermoplasmata archaeon]RLF38695.1 MAG: nickel-responsive transcriptional regulator NikR [Thermoplasmata archaeon]RLF53758.1 MAG: nickel-responsive transcriptional regulator NikR [Thermoplasmata archaeon]HDN51491.1 nickel-responsive transcriptional regulator NikR [Thermoplasmatales archaeon]
MGKISRFGVSIEHELLGTFDRTIKKKGYTNRSEAIRDLIRDFLVRERWEQSDETVVGALTIIFDHEKRGISDRLIELQHDEHPHIISTMHIHLDKHHCMETLAIKGKASEVKRIADRLISTKGVKHGKLIMTAI